MDHLLKLECSWLKTNAFMGLQVKEISCHLQIMKIAHGSIFFLEDWVLIPRVLWICRKIQLVQIDPDFPENPVEQYNEYSGQSKNWTARNKNI